MLCPTGGGLLSLVFPASSLSRLVNSEEGLSCPFSSNLLFLQRAFLLFHTFASIRS